MHTLLAISLLLLPLATCAAAPGPAVIRPGVVWKDLHGAAIQAHGGGILVHNGTYYWYGEDKTHGWFNSSGVSGYSSRDLVTWKRLGLVLPKAAFPAQFQDTGVCERPKVLYNRKTRKYVMWMHLDAANYSVSAAGIAVADRPEGPFTFQRFFRPRPESTFRDMNLLQDSDGRAYVFYSGEGNATMHVVRLNAEYTGVEEPMVEGRTWARIFAGASPEAPAPFQFGKRYYIITSACTGWKPNAAQYAWADSVLGPWTVKDNPCDGADAGTTFQSQSTFVLPLPGGRPNEFIYMGDRWKPEDLADSRYIWLPFAIQEDGSFRLKWQDEWALPKR
ncbi:MAG TPA: glycoside hydrolase family 43 protein [Armatimonadota bacterium]|jgi:beta-xylosidase